VPGSRKTIRLALCNDCRDDYYLDADNEPPNPIREQVKVSENQIVSFLLRTSFAFSIGGASTSSSTWRAKRKIGS